LEKLEIIFLETSLELIPNELKKDKLIENLSKKLKAKPDFMLLDISLHYKAMLKLKNFNKRGRPDIIHLSLLNILEKPYSSNIDVYMQVHDGRVFKFRNDIRLPKNYERFKGLMAQLLYFNKVPLNSEKPLIWKISDSLKEFLNGRKLILLSEDGEDSNIEEIIESSKTLNFPIGIGAFAHGNFSKNIDYLTYKKYRLFNGLNLKAWDITCILSSFLLNNFYKLK
jgi:rRNA small subunit pseudouridine methyltransferase Nep1